MDVKLRILGISAALAVSAFILLFPEDTSPPLPDPSSVMDYGVEIIASNLEKPRSVGIAKDGTIFVSEKSCKTHIVSIRGKTYKLQPSKSYSHHVYVQDHPIMHEGFCQDLINLPGIDLMSAVMLRVYSLVFDFELLLY